MYECKIIADSVNELGKRLTTFEVTFPRIVLAEAKTHRAFSGWPGNIEFPVNDIEIDFNNLGINDDQNLSRNSASSRAIPFRKQLERVITDPFIPERFPIDGKGMQSNSYIYGNSDVYEEAKKQWIHARDSAINEAEMLYGCLDKFADVGHVGVRIHKQIVNRLLEPFMWHTAIITATEWDNFFSQRCSENAQYEIKRIADLMYEAYHSTVDELIKGGNTNVKHRLFPSTTGATYQQIAEGIGRIAPQKELKQGEWHLPYIDEETIEAIKLAMATEQVPKDMDPDDKISKLLTEYVFMNEETYNEVIVEAAKHISVARCARVSYLNQDGKRDIQSDLDLYNRLVEGNHWSPFEHIATPHTGLFDMNTSLINSTRSNRDDTVPCPLRDKNFIGWKQFRSYFPNENVTDFRK